MTEDVDVLPDPDLLQEAPSLDDPSIDHLFFLHPLSCTQLQQLSPAALAYLGDSVYELFIRRFYLIPHKRIQAYHHQVVAQVRAETQARHLESLLPHLTSDELDWLKRGRNAATNRSRRVDPDVYQRATSLETLIGYLYLTNPKRLFTLLNTLDLTLQ